MRRAASEQSVPILRVRGPRARDLWAKAQGQMGVHSTMWEGHFPSPVDKLWEKQVTQFFEPSTGFKIKASKD
jgi:hypothetical protein